MIQRPGRFALIMRRFALPPPSLEPIAKPPISAEANDVERLVAVNVGAVLTGFADIDGFPPKKLGTEVPDPLAKVACEEVNDGKLNFVEDSTCGNDGDTPHDGVDVVLELPKKLAPEL